MKRTINICLMLIALIAVSGIILSSYQTYAHYKVSHESFCDINEQVSCDIVNRSEYSKMFGIPVALLGVIGYIAFLILSLLLLKDIDFSKVHRKIRTRDVYYSVFLLVLAAFMFSLFLTYIEVYVLHAICPLCVTSAIFIATILVLSIVSLISFIKSESFNKRA
ncbi:MAG: vitamin K epoxide reductase family protein [Candidatus Woesearchaeota archaeon]